MGSQNPNGSGSLSFPDSPTADPLKSSPLPFRVECGWCGILMEPGAPGALTSHGICPPCSEKMLQDFRAREVNLASALWDISRYMAESFQPAAWAPVAIFIPWVVLSIGGGL